MRITPYFALAFSFAAASRVFQLSDRTFLLLIRSSIYHRLKSIRDNIAGFKLVMLGAVCSVDR